jgi:hypothetical protein
MLRSLRYLIRLRVLPWRVAWFHWRAYRLATQIGDDFSLRSATRPEDLATLLELAGDRRHVVELGTGTAWTAISLATARADREVVTYDPVLRAERERYLALVSPRVRARVRFTNEPGSTGPRDGVEVDLLSIDSTHERQVVLDEMDAWRPALRAGALVVLDDFAHPDFPGVREAVHELGLNGAQHGTLFVSAA